MNKVFENDNLTLYNNSIDDVIQNINFDMIITDPP